MKFSGLELFYVFLIFISNLLFISLTVFWSIKIKKNIVKFETKTFFIFILIIMFLMNFLMISAFILENFYLFTSHTTYQNGVLLPIWLTFFSWFLCAILLVIFKKLKKSRDCFKGIIN